MNKIKARVIGRTRRGRITRLATALVLVPVVAFAVILILGRITGTVTFAAPPTMQWSAASFYNPSSTSGNSHPITSTDGSGIVLNAQYATLSKRHHDTFNLGVTGAMPGAEATVTAFVAPSKSGLVVQGVNLGSGLDATLVPGQTVDGMTTLGCGDAVRLPTNGNGTEKLDPVSIRLTIPAGSTGSYSLPSDAGLTLVPAGQYDPAQCEEATG